MADTKMNLWNDADGEEEGKPRGRKGLRRFLTFFLVLVAVLALVLAAAWRDGTGFDALQRYLNYGKSDAVSGETVYEYDASPQNRFAMLGDKLVVASDTGIRILDQEGGEVWAKTANLANPALAQGGGRAVVYGVGGTELYLLGQEGELLHLSAAEEEPFVAATLNENGWLAVTTEKNHYKGSVTVYDTDLEQIFKLDSASRFVVDAYVTDDHKRLAVVMLGQEEGVFVSNVVLYPLSAEGALTQSAEDGEGIAVGAVAEYDVPDGLAVAVDQQEDRIVTVADTCLTFASLDGEVEATVSFGDDFLRGYALEGDGFAALLLNQYQSGSVGRLVTVGPDGAELASLDVNEEVLDISAAGRYLAVLYGDSLVIYNPQLQVYASLQGTDFASGVLMREDGSALLLSAGNAEIFLP